MKATATKINKAQARTVADAKSAMAPGWEWISGEWRGDQRPSSKSRIEAETMDFVNLTVDWLAYVDLPPVGGPVKVAIPSSAKWMRSPTRPKAKHSKTLHAHNSWRAPLIAGRLKHLKAWAMALRKAWSKDGDSRQRAEHTLDAILAADRLRGERPPLQFQIRLEHSQPTFEPRDKLDLYAFTILTASERGLLRMCKGREHGLDCPTPYLIVSDKRTVYCETCAEAMQKRVKRSWWAKHGSSEPKHRKRMARAQ